MADSLVGTAPVKITVDQEPIQPGEFASAMGQAGHGAVAYFFGAVRDRNHGRQVTAVSYDAFAPLAARTLEAICEEARRSWGEDLVIHVRHRTGKLRVGEVSVAIGVSSVHRDEAFQASRYVIEELKKRVPIWKKEYYVDGETRWLRGHALCGQGHH